MASTSMKKPVRSTKRRRPTGKVTARKSSRRVAAKQKVPAEQEAAVKQEVAVEPKAINQGEMLALRERMAKHRPRFIRQESWRYGRIRGTWRKPRGVDSKIRLSVKGWPHLVRVGYRGPSVVRGLHPSGFRDILVHNVVELGKLNPKTDAARLASTLGARKREVVVAKAKELGVKVLNPTGLRFVGRKV